MADYFWCTPAAGNRGIIICFLPFTVLERGDRSVIDSLAMSLATSLTILSFALVFSLPLVQGESHNLRLWITLDAAAYRVLGSDTTRATAAVHKHMTRVNTALTQANLTVQVTGFTIQEKEVDKARIRSFEEYFQKVASKLPDTGTRHDLHQFWTANLLDEGLRHRSEWNKSCGIHANGLVQLNGLYDSGIISSSNEHILEFFILKTLVENLGMEAEVIGCSCETRDCFVTDRLWSAYSMPTSFPSCAAKFVVDKFFGKDPICPEVKDPAETVIPVCGNGILEKKQITGVSVEECDCSVEDAECRKCCIASACRLDGECLQPVETHNETRPYKSVQSAPASPAITTSKTTAATSSTTRVEVSTTLTTRATLDLTKAATWLTTTPFTSTVPQPVISTGLITQQPLQFSTTNVGPDSHTTTETQFATTTDATTLITLNSKKVEDLTVMAGVTTEQTPAIMNDGAVAMNFTDVLPSSSGEQSDSSVPSPSPATMSNFDRLPAYGVISIGVALCILLILVTNLLTCLIMRRKARQRFSCPEEPRRPFEKYL